MVKGVFSRPSTTGSSSSTYFRIIVELIVKFWFWGEGLGLRVWGLECGVYGLWFRVQGSGFRF